MNLTGSSRFNQAHVEWAIRLRYSPMPQLDMDILASQLNAFRIGELRVIGKTWEIMYERDAELGVNSDKRKSDAAGLDWQVVSDGSLVGDRHAEALQYFYDNAKATKALDQDSTGGTDELIYQVMSSLDFYYSAHEMLLRVDNPAAREVTAEFRHTPVWFFEARRGYLGYLQHIFDMYGQPCISGEWLTAVNHGWMRSLSLIFALKAFALRDWSLFNVRYGSGFLDGETDASQDTPEWQQALDAMNALANDGAVLHRESVRFKFLEQSARNNLPFQPMVEWCNSLYAKCYRGVDLATGSRHGSGGKTGSTEGGGKNVVGASVQSEESGIFLLRDAKWLTGVFNERIDRPVIRYLFGQEPRAWFALMPPADDNTADDLLSLQALVPMGLRIALKEVYKRFRWTVPADNDPCLTAPAQATPPGEDQVDENGKPVPQSKSPQQKPAAVLPAEEPKVDDGKTLPAQEDDQTPIGAGARPGAFQTGAVAMPSPQVDSAGFWSRAGLSNKNADGQTLPMPSLGYALPNDRLEVLQRRGLGNSRAAQSLRHECRRLKAVALENEASNLQARLAEELHATLAPVRVRLEKILQISDPDSQRAAIEKLLRDYPALMAAIKADDSAAKIVSAEMINNFISGLKTQRAAATQS